MCLGENVPTQVFFLWIALEGLAQSRKLFYLQESLSQTEMSLECGHFQPEVELSSSFIWSCIAVASEWASLLHLLSMLPPGLAYEKVYLIVSFMPFSCLESFIGSFSPEVTLCLALIFLWSRFLASSTHTRPFGPGILKPNTQDRVFAGVHIFHPFVKKLLIFQTSHPERSPLIYANISFWYIQVSFLSFEDPTIYLSNI